MLNTIVREEKIREGTIAIINSHLKLLRISNVRPVVMTRRIVSTKILDHTVELIPVKYLIPDTVYWKAEPSPVVRTEKNAS